jgi:hypothetical protein
MKHFQVRNWSKFQHYKNRNPPWIKLHTGLLENYEFASLQDASKLLAMCIWLLAARSDNKMPADPDWIKSKCNLKTKPDLGPLFDGGFIEWIQELPLPEQDASVVLADCKQSATSERERETEEIGASAPSFDPSLIVGLHAEAWSLWIEHRSKIKKPIKPHALGDAAEELAKLGDQQLATVKRSRANGWQGLFPEKNPPGAKPKSNPFQGAQ